MAFDIHYWPNGTEVQNDQVEVGIWLYPEDYQGEYRQTLTLYFLNGGRGFDIAVRFDDYAINRGIEDAFFAREGRP